MNRNSSLLPIRKRSKVKLSKGETSPLMTQYYQIKKQYPQAVLLFRVGDFYETFDDDAKLISKELGIALTKRNNGGQQTPLAGFPFHAVEVYVPKLVQKGYKVAICEQTESPSEARKAQKKIVNRAVKQITTPGVTFSEKILNHKHNNYLVAIYSNKECIGFSYADVSTGEFGVCEVPPQQLSMLLANFHPAEILVGDHTLSQISFESSYNQTSLEEWVWSGDYGYRVLTSHFDTRSLKGFGIENLEIGYRAAGALLHYVQQTQKVASVQFKKIVRYDYTEHMVLDEATQRNLELVVNIGGEEKEATLVEILDTTCTAMGARLLRRWATRPLRNLKKIQQRMDGVAFFFSNHTIRREFRQECCQVGDIERLISRVCVGRADTRDMIALHLSLLQIPRLKKLISNSAIPIINDLAKKLPTLHQVSDRIIQTLIESPSSNLRMGGFIRKGVNKELDQLRSLQHDSKSHMAKIWEKLSKETGIPSLKIGYNKVFGYYIEVTHTHKEKVPTSFIRKQTLVNAERYITPELKELEEKILSAEERSKELEYELFCDLRIFVTEFANDIQRLAESVAHLDTLQSFAQVSAHHGYIRPVIDHNQKLTIVQGRHPVVEHFLPEGVSFIPNDLEMDQLKNQIFVITGPNMAGKSVILRQTGLIVLMAHVGCFVPAKSAHIGLTDRIFTRVGAADNMAGGESTFLVEMHEAANILHNATNHSLVLIDEVGRGTSTFDGLSIAWAMVEYLHNTINCQPMTLFATHYHELSLLEQQCSRVRNVTMAVKEDKDKLIFLYKLIDGYTDHSYGIHVASMAGLPQPLIYRAKEILLHLEKNSYQLSTVSVAGNNKDIKDTMSMGKKKFTHALKELEKKEAELQIPLFDLYINPEHDHVINKIKELDLDRMTPIESMMFLMESQRKLNSSS